MISFVFSPPQIYKWGRIKCVPSHHICHLMEASTIILHQKRTEMKVICPSKGLLLNVNFFTLSDKRANYLIHFNSTSIYGALKAIGLGYGGRRIGGFLEGTCLPLRAHLVWRETEVHPVQVSGRPWPRSTQGRDTSTKEPEGFVEEAALELVREGRNLWCWGHGGGRGSQNA